MKARRIMGTTLSLAFLAAGVCACGGGSSGGDSSIAPGAVAQVGATAITRPALNHWMGTILGGDFFEIAHVRSPGELVSDPPDYARCAAGLKSLWALSASAPSAVQLTKTCEELNPAIKQQTLSFLISTSELLEQASELGLHASEPEVQQDFKQVVAQLPKSEPLPSYLANRRWTPSDYLYLLRKDLLSSKLLAGARQKYSTEQQLTSFFDSLTIKWTSKVSCRPGYVVAQCDHYRGSKGSSSAPPPAILLEDLKTQLPAAHAQRLAPDLNCKNSKGGTGVTCERVGR